VAGKLVCPSGRGSVPVFGQSPRPFPRSRLAAWLYIATRYIGTQEENVIFLGDLKPESRPFETECARESHNSPGHPPHVLSPRTRGFLPTSAVNDVDCFQQSAKTSAGGGGPGSADPILPIDRTSSRSRNRGASRTGRGRSPGPFRNHRIRRSHPTGGGGGGSHNRSCSRSRSGGGGGGSGGGSNHNRRSGPERSSWEQPERSS